MPAPWRPSSAGTASVVTMSNFYQDIRPPAGSYFATGSEASEWPKCWHDFSGGIYAPRVGGQFGLLLAHGGGHSSSNCNAVMAIDFNPATPRWIRLTDPSTANRSDAPRMGGNSGELLYGYNRSYCELGDGQPGACHSYGTLIFIPNTYQPRRLPAARLGWLLRATSGAVIVTFSDNTTGAHICALNSLTDRAQNKWYRLTEPVSGAWGPGMSASFDPSRMQVFVRASPSSTNNVMIDLNARLTVRHSLPFDGLVAASPDSRTQLYIPAPHDVHIIMHHLNDGSARLWWRAGGDTTVGWQVVNLTGDVPPNAGGATTIRGDYVPELNRLVLFRTETPSTSTYYEVAIPSVKSNAWVSTQRSWSGTALAWISGGDGSAHDNRKTFWHSAAGCFVSKQNTDWPAANQFWVMRPLGV